MIDLTDYLNRFHIGFGIALIALLLSLIFYYKVDLRHPKKQK